MPLVREEEAKLMSEACDYKYLIVMKMYVSLALILVNLTLGELINPRVETPSGPIEGFEQISRGGRAFHAYEGIPYAKPPIGELRFEPPQPVDAWDAVLMAKFPSSVCVQYVQGNAERETKVTGSEDCLYLNVYSPADKGPVKNRTKLLPVIFYLFGGAFQMGGGAEWRPHYLMDEDLVYVSLNYRVGPLGFLSTEDGVVPGNMGLKDQVLALQWVSKNIAAFGGDPKNITLAGSSSGGACVHYHFLSPMSRGLFHRGISMSGTALHCWAQAEASLEKAKKLASLMKCPTSRNEEMIKCLKTQPAKTMVENEIEFMVWPYNPFAPFGPVVENGSSNPFIDKSPIDIIQSGEIIDVPWIISSSTEEGLYPATEFITDKKWSELVDKNWEELAPFLLDYNYTIPRSKHKQVSRFIRRTYMADKCINLGNLNEVIPMLGDRLFGVDTEKAAKEQARVNKSPVWFYYFGYRGEYSISNTFTGTKESFGVAHSDESYYLFANPKKPLRRVGDLNMSLTFVHMWSSFATTGIPDMGIDWPRVDNSTDELIYLRISNSDNLRIETTDNFANKKFWQTIDFNENKEHRKNLTIT